MRIIQTTFEQSVIQSNGERADADEMQDDLAAMLDFLEDGEVLVVTDCPAGNMSAPVVFEEEDADNPDAEAKYAELRALDSVEIWFLHHTFIKAAFGPAT